MNTQDELRLLQEIEFHNKLCIFFTRNGNEFGYFDDKSFEKLIPKETSTRLIDGKTCIKIKDAVRIAPRLIRINIVNYGN